jgi:hypothetical protein
LVHASAYTLGILRGLREENEWFPQGALRVFFAMLRWHGRMQVCIIRENFMDIECFKVSAVLVAKGHNPTILHPCFLKNEEIVPTDWELSQDPICTPPFSAVSFLSGFSFVVEQEKLQVNFTGDNADQQTGMAAEMAGKYAAKLPYVQYTAVGVNFTVFVPLADPASFIIQRFIKEGPWDCADLKLAEARQNFTYAFDDHTLNVSVESGMKKSDNQQTNQSGIILHANYHVLCSENDLLGSARYFLEQAVSRIDHFKNVVLLYIGGK